MKRNMAVIAVAALGFLSLFAAWAAPESHLKVTVQIKGLADQKGQLLAALFIQPKGFPNDSRKAFQTDTVAVTGEVVSVTFTNVPAGKCAVGVCHDQDLSGDMAASLLGRPREGYGVSMNPEKRMGPPRFSDACFNISTQDVSITVKMIYP